MTVSRTAVRATLQGVLALAILTDTSRSSAQSSAYRPDDLVIDYGSDGLWTLVGGTYTLLHPASPEHLAARDIDGDGLDEIAIDFGDNGGVWLYRDNVVWDEVDRGTRHTPLAFGDFDYDGSTQLAVVVESQPIGTGYRVAVMRVLGGGASAFPAPEAPLDIHTARLHLTAGDDLIASFPNDGIQVCRDHYHTFQCWSQLHPQSAQSMVVGDFDHDGRDEVAIGFANGYGTWMYRDGRTWLPIHSVSAARIAAGDLDGNGITDFVFDFGPGYGLWIYKNFTSWELLHPSTAEVLAMADLDGNGISEIIVGFGHGTGVWIFENNTRWVHHSDMTPKQIIVAHLH